MAQDALLSLLLTGRFGEVAVLSGGAEPSLSILEKEIQETFVLLSRKRLTDGNAGVKQNQRQLI